MWKTFLPLREVENLNLIASLLFIYLFYIGESDGMDQRELAPFHHAVIVFPGSLRSMEDVLNEDSKLEVKDPRDLFDLYVNPLTGSCGGGSHIRTEESLLISLSVFRPKLVSSGINNNNNK